jgi:LmbE family N-acetylglucosaminyl deacetylase
MQFDEENSVERDLAKGLRLIVISPHLDDAVLGCTGLLTRCPGSIVCTVFTGEPATPIHTEWDEASGFADSHEALQARRLEDARALALCRAEPVWLDFLDAQYGSTPAVEAVADALAAQFVRLDAYLPVCPFGFWHPDHELVGAACRLLLRTRRVPRYIAYEDAIHREMPGARRAGFARLDADGLSASAMSTRPRDGTAALKRQAVQAYASQMRAFAPFPSDVARAERYWWVERRDSAPHCDQPTRRKLPSIPE